MHDQLGSLGNGAASFTTFARSLARAD
jgi:hypothetical protein